MGYGVMVTLQILVLPFLVHRNRNYWNIIMGEILQKGAQKVNYFLCE